MKVYLKSSTGVAVWSCESRIADTTLFQTVSMSPTLVFTCWSDIKVLHTPLNVRVLLVKPEPYCTEERRQNKYLSDDSTAGYEADPCVLSKDADAEQLTSQPSCQAEDRLPSSTPQQGRRLTAERPDHHSGGQQVSTEEPGTSK